ncbi:MAG: hypothetical protein IPJ76_04410 [Flavobacteriales bacterium]|nr:MAG: hypothetical protein IPJ76_04410 [Flavobacteriales bacterium]
MDSAMVLGKMLHRPVQVLWAPEPGLAARFHDLFEPVPGVRMSDHLGIAASALLRWGRHPMLRSAWRRLTGGAYYHFDMHEELVKDIGMDGAGLAHGPVRIANVSRFFGTAPRYAQFLPVARLRQRIEEVADRFTNTTIGVHIRRTDNVESIAVSTDERFVAHMLAAVEADPATTFYLASDSHASKRSMLDRFGDRVVTDMRPTERGTLAGMEEAVVQLYALARTRKVLGSYWSSFSHTAAHIGGIDEVIVR